MRLEKTISVIVAMTDSRVIGNNGKIPWHIPEDFAWFKDKTMGKPIVMGRKTFDSIGKVLSGRKNIVITRTPVEFMDGKDNENLKAFSSLEEALIYCEMGPGKEVMIIGGSEIYKTAIDLGIVSKYYLTRVIPHTFIKGDTFFPDFKLYNWNNTYRHSLVKDDKLVCVFEIWDKPDDLDS